MNTVPIFAFSEVNWWVLLLAPVFWQYFHLMSIEPVERDGSMAPKLRRPHLFPPDVMRAVICLLPFSVNIPEDRLPFIGALALTTVIGPLQMPGFDPGAEDLVSKVQFFGKWLAAEFDRWLKTLLVSGVFLLLALVPFLRFLKESDSLRIFMVLPRQPDCLELPVWFYVTAYLMLAIRWLMLTGISRKKAKIGLISGIFALSYFYNLSGQLKLTTDNWESSVSGLLGALLIKFWSALSFACMDRDYAYWKGQDE